jgi:polygalacturonase
MNRNRSLIWLTAAFIVLCIPAVLAQQTVLYENAPGLTISPDFTVKVNGKPTFTESIGNGGMENLNVAGFACEGTQTITVTASSAIKSYALKPKSYNLKANVSGRTLTFKINGPQKVYIEINDLPHLAIFADPLEKNAPNKSAGNVVYFGPGVHDVKNITLQSNQTVYIAAGATVNANVRGRDLHNVTITGRGRLNGNVQVARTTNLQVDGIFVRNTSGWSNTLIDCTNSGYKNVKVFSYKGVWGLDGINPVSCKNFSIDDCFIRTRDDCISIKNMKAFGKDSTRNINTDSVTVKNCLLVGWAHADGVTLGFEMQGGSVKNVLVKNCDIICASGQGRTGGHSGFSIVSDGPANISTIRFEDIRVEDNIEYKNLELIVTEGRRYGTEGAGSLKGVYLKNIRWANPNKPFVIAGVPNSYVKDITFEHCYLGGTLLKSMKDADFQTEFTEDIKFIP